MKKSFTIILIMIMANTTPALAWDGYDYDSGSYIEIERGDKVRRGRDIEFYDYGTGKYHSGEVQDVNRRFSGVEVEVYDHETGETRTFEMDDDN